jgi:hypothetical protein
MTYPVKVDVREIRNRLVECKVLDHARSAVNTDLSEFAQSNCCYSHDWPCFIEPVHPYDYSEDWNLEEEWDKKQSRIEKATRNRLHQGTNA